MAGDWIKFEKATLDKPEVFEMASDLGIDPDAVIGKLLRVWDWFDDQSENGNAPVTVRALLDRYSGVIGFTSSMESVGWLLVEGDLMTIPNFERHNGQTAKTRALTAKRVSKSKAKANAKGNADTVTPSVSPSLAEKRREEKRTKSVSIIKAKFIPPTIEEFTAYLVTEMPAISEEWTEERVTIAANLQFETYEGDGWKDGNGKQIKRWKTKAKNAFAYKKPWNYGTNENSKRNTRGSMSSGSSNGSKPKSTGAGDGISVPFL